jgi:predicted porin
MKGLGTAAASAAVVMLYGAGASYAADLNNMPVKAVPIAGPTMCTSILDFFTTACQVSAYGVRFYGTVDMGASYQTNGAPMDKYLGDNYFLGKANNGARFLQAPNPLSASNVGLQIKEPLGGGWSFVGQVEAGFNPYSGQLLSGVHSVFAAIGTPLSQQTSFGDSNSQGTFYNDLGFAGVSNDTYGTLTFFRQNSLMQDAILAYDPMGVSGAFSALGFFGGFAGGGNTQNRRDTTAIKYRVNVANWHFGVYGQVGGYNEGNAEKGAIEGDIGADHRIGPGLFSFDVIGGFRKDAVAFGTDLNGPVFPNGFPMNPNQGGISTSATAAIAGQTSTATISDNANVMVVAKYTVDRLKLYAGYDLNHFANPSDHLTFAPGTGFTDIAGDFYCSNCLNTNGTQISTTGYTKNRINQLLWTGFRYSLTDSLDLTGAIYYEWNNDWSNGGKNSSGATCAEFSTANGTCAGTRASASILIDWKFAPKWDTYIGQLYTQNTGGLDSGYLSKNTWATTAGVRFRW